MAAISNSIYRRNSKMHGRENIDIYAPSEIYCQNVLVYDTDAWLIASFGEVWSERGTAIGLVFNSQKRHYDAVVSFAWDNDLHSIAGAPGKLEDIQI